MQLCTENFEFTFYTALFEESQFRHQPCLIYDQENASEINWESFFLNFEISKDVKKFLLPLFFHPWNFGGNKDMAQKFDLPKALQNLDTNTDIHM